MNDDTLIDSFYEAAVLPELWPRVLDRVAEPIRAIGGSLFTMNWQFSGWTSSQSMIPLMNQTIESGWAARNSRIERSVHLRHPGFIRDQDLFTPEEIEQDPFYRHARSIGCGWVTGTYIEAPTGDTVHFSWERRYVDGPYGADDIAELDMLRPHLARAALLSGRLALERAKAATEALALIGLPAAVVSMTHRLLAGNKLLDDLTPRVLQDRTNRVMLSDPRADELFKVALGRLDPSSGQNVRSIPVRSKGEGPPLIVHLVPVRGHARDIFSSASCILVVTPVTPQPALSGDVIRGLFDLTPAEARVARGIVQSLTVADIAVSGGVSAGTVRQQLRSVFAKTGVSRQAELVGLLAGHAITEPPGDGFAD